MIFSEDNIQKQTDTVNPTWALIESSLKIIDPSFKSYCILTDNLSSYVQCAGSKDRLTIEYRKTSVARFKHFVIGNKIKENSTAIVWTQIDCKVGPIFIHDNEVLTVTDAVIIFKAFYDNEDLPLIYNYRNNTRTFGK